MRSRLRPLGALVASALTFATAWHLELWLVVIAMSAAAIALIIGERLEEHMLAQRAAALALYAPRGKVEGSRLEETVVADLAAVAAGDTALLEYTVILAEIGRASCRERAESSGGDVRRTGEGRKQR